MPHRLPKEINITLTPEEFYQFLDHAAADRVGFAIYAKARELARRLPRRQHAIEGSCSMCDEHRKNPDEIMPSHDASHRCESGWKPHCTCDTCF